jgi:hypothetical protein
MMDEKSILREVTWQKEISEWERIITSNLIDLAKALKIASTERWMSQEHAKNIWKSYLKVSGMDIPRELKGQVIQIIEDEKSSEIKD